jgi:phosphoribosylaminoimidazole-succinocarboxamide synthase
MCALERKVRVRKDGRVELLHSGKVRDVYLDPASDELILVASDRISVYDVVLPTPIPDKGAILTQLSLWWFTQLAGIVPDHVVSATDVPAEWAGRAIRCKRLRMVPVECVARGYLAGSGTAQYNATGDVSGVVLPPGLVEGSRLPEPIFTPTTKAAVGDHDEPMTMDEVRDAVGPNLAEELVGVTLEIYRRGAALAAERGIIIADTKIEVGLDEHGKLTLGDELLTPDSSRVWPADTWLPGRPQPSLDKQFVRDWAAGTGWDKKPPAPAVPADVVAATRAKYVEVYELLTGERWG